MTSPFWAGARGLFDGISGTWMRQMSYSLCRFWAYDESKRIIGAGESSPLVIFFSIFQVHYVIHFANLAMASSAPRAVYYFPCLTTRLETVGFTYLSRRTRCTPVETCDGRMHGYDSTPSRVEGNSLNNVPLSAAGGIAGIVGNPGGTHTALNLKGQSLTCSHMLQRSLWYAMATH